jgi:hypothetical protein
MTILPSVIRVEATETSGKETLAHKYAPTMIDAMKTANNGRAIRNTRTLDEWRLAR